MKKYQVYQVDAFTPERFKGNPAGVVSNADGLTEFQMQQIARELNNSETAFILSPVSDDHEAWIRFFTPTTEVPSCGHATIAAHYIRAVEKKLPLCTVFHKIGIGILPVEIIPDDPGYKIIMTQGEIEFSTPLGGDEYSDILSVLGLDVGDLNERCPLQIVSTGNSKVLVGIKEIKRLNALRPDLQKLVDISRRIRCSGYYVFTLNPEDRDILAHGRMFAPAIGIPEDPVTGNANGPLGAYLVQHGLVAVNDTVFYFKAIQGEAIGRPGIAEVSVEVSGGKPTKVKVGGHAVIVFRTEIEL